MKIRCNDLLIDCSEEETLFSLRDRVKGAADVVIINGFQVSVDMPLQEGDNVVLIRRGEIPSREELEYMLIARHTPNLHYKIKNSSAVVAGLGGLGSNIAVSLVRLGIGRIRIIDFDVVEPSNINRQCYFLDQIGVLKSEALKETLLRISPFVEIDAVNCRITEDNMDKLISGYDVIFEAFDRAEEKAFFIRRCMVDFGDKIVVGASGVAGYGDIAEMKVKGYGKNIYIIGDGVSEAAPGFGLIASRVAAAANMQVNVALNIIAGVI